jgi:SPP1 gp7 family putative phage head morphogenesis protein
MRSITTGNGLQTLVPFIKKHKTITEKRARMIALDQTRKANVALTAGRLRNAGIQHFQWIFTGGGKTYRELHKHMNGEVYEFSNPPVIQKDPMIRGLPGDLINCRCRLRPVLRFNED